VLSRINPIVSPALTWTVAVAGVGFTLQVMSGEVTSVTGELLTGVRTAAVLVLEPAMRVVQMSKLGSESDMTINTIGEQVVLRTHSEQT
jgi:hypothetical protein